MWIVILVGLVLIGIIIRKNLAKSNREEQYGITANAKEIITKRESIIELAKAKNLNRKYKTAEKIIINSVGMFARPDAINSFIQDAYKATLLSGYEKEGVNEAGFHNAPIPIVNLIPVSHNPKDKNAVEIHIRISEQFMYHIGYVPREQCLEVRRLLSNDSENQILIVNPILTFLRGAGRFEYEHGVRVYVLSLEKLNN